MLTDRCSRIAAITCLLLIIAFAAISYSAALTKNATADEPLHAVSAFVTTFHHDFRINPEDPPLWKYWAMLPHRRDALKLNFDDPEWRATLTDTDRQIWFCVPPLYRTPGADGAAFINRSRAMMVLLSVALAVLVAIWARQLAGPIAAVAAVAFFCLDPNFIAHSPLVKNDVAISLIIFATAFAAYHLGRRITVTRLLVACAIAGLAPAVKFSGIYALPLFALCLLVRAMIAEPWVTRWGVIETRRGRFGVAVGVSALAMMMSIVIIWASYGFRFAPTSQDPSIRLNLQNELKMAAAGKQFLRTGTPVASDELDRLPIPPPLRIIQAIDQKHLMPHAWNYGFAYTYRHAIARPSFLLGEYGMTGWWYYFPLAMLFKTPVGTLLAAAGASVLLFRRSRPKLHWPHAWAIATLLLPPAIYMAIAMRTNLNLGLRHVLPVYPFIFVALGIAAAKVWNARVRAARIALTAIPTLLLIETAVAYPNYIAFFNAPSGGSRGGLRLLSDSNLDWGQDLPLLAEWQKRHPNEKLYLLSFGSVDPAFYGIRYTKLAGGFFMGEKPETVTTPGVIAISATQLQGTHFPQIRADAQRLRNRPPREVLGGTIYLYDTPGVTH
jgi:4-amino-4-deoxy-L-arabinose transferase-like glycosyltransferase